MGKLKLPSLYEAVYGMPGSFDGRYGFGGKLQRDPGLGDNQGAPRSVYINMDSNLNPEDSYELTDDEEELGEDIFNKIRGHEYASGNALHPNDYGYMPSYNAGIAENATTTAMSGMVPNLTFRKSNGTKADKSTGMNPVGFKFNMYPGSSKTGDIYGPSRPYYSNDEEPEELTYKFSIDGFAMDKDEHAELSFKKQFKNMKKVQKSIKSNF